MNPREIVSWAACGTIVAVLIGLVLFSGGGDPADDESEAAETAIKQMLSRTLTESDPAQCTEDFTPQFLRQNFGDGDELERCIRVNSQDEDPSAERVQVDRVTITGATAEAVIEASGGGMDGSIITVEVVHDFDRWKLDRMVDVQIDRAKFDRVIEERALENGLSPDETRCYVAAFARAVSDEELERLSISGEDPDFNGIGINCISKATLVRQIGEEISQSMEGDDIPQPVIDCVVHRLTHGLSGAQLRALVATRGNGRFGALSRAAGFACGRDYSNGLLPRSGRS
jgi:hypothetical protein